jgi:hypothetical protein
MVEGHKGVQRARFFDVAFPQDDSSTAVTVLRACDSDYVFERENKGFEGAVVMTGADGVDYLLALCEGNHCGVANRHLESGNGRIVVMERSIHAESGRCTVQVLSIPSSCNFMGTLACTPLRHQGFAPISRRLAAPWCVVSSFWLSLTL